MRAKDDGFVRPRLAGDFAEHILAFHHLLFHRIRSREFAVDSHRLEIALSRRDPQFRKIQSCAIKQFLRGFIAYPTLQGKTRHFSVRFGDAVILALRAFNHTPAIASCFGFMDDQRSNGAAPRCFFKFIGPSAVIGHRTAAEFVRNGFVGSGGKIRIIDQKDRDLSLQVHILIIVPSPLGRGHAIADKNHFRVLDHRPVSGLQRRHIDILAGM